MIAGKILAVIEYLSAVNITIGIQKAHGAFHEDRLTGAGFAHDGKALTLINIKRNTPQCVKDLSPKSEFDIQVLHREDHIVFRIVNGTPLLTLHGSWDLQHQQKHCR